MGSSFLIECLAMAAVILVVIRVSRLAVVSQLVDVSQLADVSQLVELRQQLPQLRTLPHQLQKLPR